MNIDRTKINMSQLRTNNNFRLLVELLQQELADRREEYENTPASEFLRGRVVSMKELIDELNRPTAAR